MSLRIRAQNLLTTRDPTGLMALVLLPLTLAGKLWCAVLTARRNMYRNGTLKSARGALPVVCVGNITLGGTGKTPIVEKLCELAQKSRMRPVVISRGYGGSLEGQVALVADGDKLLLSAREAGDEPVLLAERLGNVPVVIGADRHSAVQFAANNTDADLAILDDGYQHLKLVKDQSLVVIDASRPFGNGHCIPRGMLREPMSALVDADAIVLTRVDRVNPARLEELKKTIAHVAGDAPVLEATHEPACIKVLGEQTQRPVQWLEGRKVLAFAGIGRPEGFFSTLGALGAKVTHAVEYADHHPYDARDMEKLANWARISNAEALVTTEKDGVRLQALDAAPRTAACVMLLGIEMRMSEADLAVLEGLLEKARSRHKTL